MSNLLSKKKKLAVAAMTFALMVFSVSMIVFGDNKAALNTKASSIHAPHLIP